MQVVHGSRWSREHTSHQHRQPPSARHGARAPRRLAGVDNPRSSSRSHPRSHLEISPRDLTLRSHPWLRRDAVVVPLVQLELSVQVRERRFRLIPGGGLEPSSHGCLHSSTEGSLGGLGGELIGEQLPLRRLEVLEGRLSCAPPVEQLATHLMRGGGAVVSTCMQLDGAACDAPPRTQPLRAAASPFRDRGRARTGRGTRPPPSSCAGRHARPAAGSSPHPSAGRAAPRSSCRAVRYDRPPGRAAPRVPRPGVPPRSSA